jgi:hypothetical protein
MAKATTTTKSKKYWKQRCNYIALYHKLISSPWRAINTSNREKQEQINVETTAGIVPNMWQTRLIGFRPSLVHTTPTKMHGMELITTDVPKMDGRTFKGKAS